jgi:hypothetical protein
MIHHFAARLLTLLLACVYAWPVNAAAGPRTPDLVLKGTVEGSDHQTYKLVPFEVPAGVKALEVRFEYTGREARTTIDLGLLGPGEDFAQAFRGWSGGNKKAFGLSRIDATPSYLSGPVGPGQWNLLLGVPNIRSGQTSQFVAEIFFTREGEVPAPVQPVVLRGEPGWYRGDLHMHSGHSDGSCATKSGSQRAPCPLFLTLDAAADRGLDFVAVTEHNTVSHVRELTALQPYFDRLLLIPGMEMTTFQGHANAFNVREPVDFRVGSTQVPDWNALLTAVAKQGAIVSINHPNAPSGEACMGCGWTAQPAADMSRIQAVEVVNGHDVESKTAGLPFWEQQLQLGHRLTAIGGSDTHDVTAKSSGLQPARIAVPTTVVHASSLGIEAILEGIRSGNVFVDTAGTRDRLLEFSARNGTESVPMGSLLGVRRGQSVEFQVRVANVSGGKVEVIRDGAVVKEMAGAAIGGDDHRLSFTQRSDGARHWVRVNVRDAEGHLVLIGNPIYLNAPRLP